MRILSQFWVEGIILNAFGNLPDLYRESNIPTLAVSGGYRGVTFCILRLL